MGHVIDSGKIPERVLERMRAGGPLPSGGYVPERAPDFDSDQFDRALAEEGTDPLVLRFRREPGDQDEADLDRLRLELESTLLRVPALRARPLKRVVIEFGPQIDRGLPEFVREVRRPFLRSAAVPLIAVLRTIPDPSGLALLREAGCAHVWFEETDLVAFASGIPKLRAMGFTSIGAEIAPEQLGHVHEAALGPEGIDGLALRSPVADLDSPDDLLWRRIGAGVLAYGALREEGFVSERPRWFHRGRGFPGLEPEKTPVEDLAFGPGAERHAGDWLWRSDLDRDRWAQAIDHGRVPPGQAFVLDEEARMRSEIIRSLVETGALSVVEIEKAYRIDFIHHFQHEMGALEERQLDGMVECNFDCIQSTTFGQLLIEDVAGVFDPSRTAPESMRPAEPRG